MWHYLDDAGQQVGPVDQAELDGLIRSGKITENTMVVREGMTEWIRYGDMAYAGVSAPAAAPTIEHAPAAEPAYAPAPAAMAVAAAMAGGPVHQCVECRNTFPDSEMVAFDNAWVCAGCKPRFVQKLKEGVAPVGVLNYAGFWIRAGAKIIDGIILQIISWLLRLAVGMPAVATVGSHPNAGATAAVTGGSFLIAIVFAVFFNGRFGATPGKMALKLKIVRPDGSPIGYPLALGRYFAEILSSVILCIGYMMAGWDDEKRALHDRLCNTRVIKL